MSNDEIADKLRRLLAMHTPPTEEYHVVYMMVEMRKLLDLNGRTGNYPLLKFYADWAVHSKKDRITRELRRMSEDLYQAAIAKIGGGHSVSPSPMATFADMGSLRIEIERFLGEQGIDITLATVRENWITFVSVLVKILENQPMVNPSANVQAILFEPAKPRFVVGKIVFSKPFMGHDHYRYEHSY